MKRVVPIAAVFAASALLAVPGANASAAPQSGAVLRVDRSHHRVEIIDPAHVVHSYAAPRRAARKLHPGAKVTFQSSGGRISSLRLGGNARKLSFYGKVVSRGGSGAVFRLGDGKQLRLAKRQSARHGHRRHAWRGSVQINLQGLQAGQLVLITQTTDRAGNVTITIKLVSSGETNANGADRDVTGTITAIDAASVTIQTDSGAAMTFRASSDVLDGFEADDRVDVTYHADADGTLVADDVEPADDGSDDSGDDLDVLGIVTAIGPASISVQADGGGPMSFEADPDLTDGFAVGDHVDVTYSQDPDGSLVADDVEFADDGDGSGE